MGVLLSLISWTDFMMMIMMSYSRSFSGSYFRVFGPNTERYEVYLRIQFKCGKVALFTQCQDYSPETWTTTSQRDTYFDQIESTDDAIIAICDHSDFGKIL